MSDNNYDSIVEQELKALFAYPVDPVVQTAPVYYHYDSLEHEYGKRTTYHGKPVSGIMYGLFDSVSLQYSFKMTLSNGWFHGPFVTYFKDTSGLIEYSGYYDTLSRLQHLIEYYDNRQVRADGFYRYDYEDYVHWRENPRKYPMISDLFGPEKVCEGLGRYTEYYRSGQILLSCTLDSMCYDPIQVKYGVIYPLGIRPNIYDTCFKFYESGVVSDFYVYRPDKRCSIYRVFDESANLIWEKRIRNKRIRYKYYDECKEKLVTKRQWRLWFDWKFKKQLPPEKYP